MGLTDPKRFKALTMSGIQDRCLKTRRTEAARKNVSNPVEIMDSPVIKDTWWIKDRSIKTVIMAYEADSAKVLPCLRNKKNAAAHREKTCAKTRALISRPVSVFICTLLVLFFLPLFLSDDLVSLA
jgi:hypothetical protein